MVDMGIDSAWGNYFGLAHFLFYQKGKKEKKR